MLRSEGKPLAEVAAGFFLSTLETFFTISKSGADAPFERLRATGATLAGGVDRRCGDHRER